MPVDRSQHPLRVTKPLNHGVQADIARRHLKRLFFYFHFRRNLSVSRSVAFLSLLASTIISGAYAAALIAPNVAAAAVVFTGLLAGSAISLTLFPIFRPKRYREYQIRQIMYIAGANARTVAALSALLPSILVSLPGRILLFLRVALLTWLSADSNVSWRVQAVFAVPAAEMILLPLATTAVLLRAVEGTDHTIRMLMVGAIMVSSVTHMIFLAWGDRFAASCRVCILSPLANYIFGIPLLLGLSATVTVAVNMLFGSSFTSAMSAFEPVELGKFLIFSSVWSGLQEFAGHLLEGNSVRDALNNILRWSVAKDTIIGLNAALFYTIAGGFTLRLGRLKATPEDRELISQARMAFTDFSQAEEIGRDISEPSMSSAAIAVRAALGRGDTESLVTSASRYARLSGDEADLDQVFFRATNLATDLGLEYAENLLPMLDKLREPDVAIYHYGFMRSEGAEAITRAIEHPSGRKHSRMFNQYVKCTRLWLEKKNGWARKIRLLVLDEKTPARRAAVLHIASTMLWGVRASAVDDDTARLISIIESETTALACRRSGTPSDYERAVGFLIVSAIRVAGVEPRAGSRIRDVLQAWSVKNGVATGDFQQRFDRATTEWELTEGLQLVGKFPSEPS